MADFQVKAIAIAALGFGVATGAAGGETPGHRFQFLATRISEKQSAAERGIDGIAFVANATDGTIYRCTGRIVLRQKAPSEPLRCHSMAYQEPAPDPLDGDLVFEPDQSKADDERARLSFFRLSQTFATIAFCTTVDESEIRCTPAATLR